MFLLFVRVCIFEGFLGFGFLGIWAGRFFLLGEFFVFVVSFEALLCFRRRFESSFIFCCVCLGPRKLTFSSSVPK